MNRQQRQPTTNNNSKQTKATVPHSKRIVVLQKAIEMNGNERLAARRELVAQRGERVVEHK